VVFSRYTPVFPTNKTDHHDITVILLKVALNTIKTNTFNNFDLGNLKTRFKLTTSVVIGTDCIGSCKSNYHTITSTPGLNVK
jgi:hypothetical protein